MPVRTGDAPLPTPVVDLHPECDAQGLHVALSTILGTLTGAPVWDTAKWDDTPAVWASPEQWADVAGDVYGLTLTHGSNARSAQPDAAHLSFQLDNSTGRYAQFDAAGNVANFTLGGTVAVWVDDPDSGLPSWKFYGRVGRWAESYGTGPNPDSRRRQSKVDVECWDASTLLNQAVDGLSYPMGAEGDSTTARLTYLAAVAGLKRGNKMTTPTVHHRAMDSTNPLLESMQVTAESDGGLVFLDADGLLVFLNREALRTGRPDQPQPVPVFADTCDPGTWDFWDGDPVTDDTDVRNRVVLTNVDDLTVEARDQPSVDRYGPRLLALQAQTWTTPEEGAALAAWVLAERSNAYFRVPGLTLHGRAPDVRVGDRVRYVRTLPNGTKVDVDLRVEGVQWEYGPGSQVLTLSTAPVTGVNVFSRWDQAVVWDTARWSY